VFEIIKLVIFLSILICFSACHEGQSTDIIPNFKTDIDSSLFQVVSFNDVEFLVPAEMSPSECDDNQCEYSVLHKEEHLLLSQLPCDQVFENEKGLHTYIKQFLDIKEKSHDQYELISIDSVVFSGIKGYILCYKDQPKGFPSITNNECFVFECNDRFNVLHAWSINDLDSSLMRKSKYTFVLK